MADRLDPLEIIIERRKMLMKQAQALLGVTDQPSPSSPRPASTTKRSSTSPRALILRLLRDRDGTTCYLCGKDLDLEDSCIEHVIPVSRGGTNEPSNVRVACMDCNARKSDHYVSFDLRRRPMYHVPRS